MDQVGAFTRPGRMDVGALPLNPSLRTKLQAAGFRTTAELEGIGPVDLAAGGRSRSGPAAAERCTSPPELPSGQGP